MTTARKVPSSTPARILEAAERLVQTRGFNGFSYADVAARLKITKASLHYHFRTKADLGRSLIADYHARFGAALAAIDRGRFGADQKLRDYVKLYADVLRKDRMCLCGMLAAEHATLPPSMQQALRGFFDENEKWLAGVLEDGRDQGVLRFEGPPREIARLLLASLEGAMMVARSYAEVDRFEAAANRLLAEIGV